MVPTTSMSTVRKLFWQEVSRRDGGSSSPRKYGLKRLHPRGREQHGRVVRRTARAMPRARAGGRAPRRTTGTARGSRPPSCAWSLGRRRTAVCQRGAISCNFGPGALQRLQFRRRRFAAEKGVHCAARALLLHPLIWTMRLVMLAEHLVGEARARRTRGMDARERVVDSAVRCAVPRRRDRDRRVRAVRARVPAAAAGRASWPATRSSHGSASSSATCSSCRGARIRSAAPARSARPRAAAGGAGVGAGRAARATSAAAGTASELDHLPQRLLVRDRAGARARLARSRRALARRTSAPTCSRSARSSLRLGLDPPARPPPRRDAVPRGHRRTASAPSASTRS